MIREPKKSKKYLFIKLPIFLLVLFENSLLLIWNIKIKYYFSNISVTNYKNEFDEIPIKPAGSKRFEDLLE